MTDVQTLTKGIELVPAPAAGLDPVVQLVGRIEAEPRMRVGIAVARYNRTLTERLLRSVVSSLVECGLPPENIRVAWVPGSYELPSAIDRMAESRREDALIALGVVIVGATSHAEMITREVTHALSTIALARRIPVIDGLVSAPDLAHAEERCGGEQDRGASLARAAIEMAHLLPRIEGTSS